MVEMLRKFEELRTFGGIYTYVNLFKIEPGIISYMLNSGIFDGLLKRTGKFTYEWIGGSLSNGFLYEVCDNARQKYNAKRNEYKRLKRFEPNVAKVKVERITKAPKVGMNTVTQSRWAEFVKILAVRGELRNISIIAKAHHIEPNLVSYLIGYSGYIKPTNWRRYEWAGEIPDTEEQLLLLVKDIRDGFLTFKKNPPPKVSHEEDTQIVHFSTVHRVHPESSAYKPYIMERIAALLQYMSVPDTKHRNLQRKFNISAQLNQFLHSEGYVKVVPIGMKVFHTWVDGVEVPSPEDLYDAFTKYRRQEAKRKLIKHWERQKEEKTRQNELRKIQEAEKHRPREMSFTFSLNKELRDDEKDFLKKYFGDRWCDWDKDGMFDDFDGGVHCYIANVKDIVPSECYRMVLEAFYFLGLTLDYPYGSLDYQHSRTASAALIIYPVENINIYDDLPTMPLMELKRIVLPEGIKRTDLLYKSHRTNTSSDWPEILEYGEVEGAATVAWSAIDKKEIPVLEWTDESVKKLTLQTA